MHGVGSVGEDARAVPNQLLREGRPVLFAAGDVEALELGAHDLPVLQAFFDANPEYFLTLGGKPAAPDEARTEFEGRPPAGMPYGEVVMIGFVDQSGSLAGMASVVSNLLADDVWHIGLYIVASRLHGTGAASAWYRALEGWMVGRGAKWLRLGALAANPKAGRFWEKMGYAEVRRRENVQMAGREHTVRVFVKVVGEYGLARYLELVARDRGA